LARGTDPRAHRAAQALRRGRSGVRRGEFRDAHGPALRVARGVRDAGRGRQDRFHRELLRRERLHRDVRSRQSAVMPARASEAAPRAPRTYLFVPGDRPERIPKALASGADAVIVDLEDAVGPDAKLRARAAVADALPAERPVLIRVNGPETQWFDGDLDLCS